jgi:tRNA (guanine9-N1)-methyltransferase
MQSTTMVGIDASQDEDAGSNPLGNSQGKSLDDGKDNDHSQKPPSDAATVMPEVQQALMDEQHASSELPEDAETKPPAEKLSKNQKKKLARMEHAREKKRQRTELKKEIKKERAQAAGRDLEAERRRQEEMTKRGEGKARRLKCWQESFKPDETFSVCVDCSFEKDMVSKEVNSLAIQLRYIYSANKRSEQPLSLVFSDVDQNGAMIRHLKNVSGFEEWESYGLNITPSPIEQVFQDRLSDLVYLTSDAPTVLDKLEPTKVYIIGGIVDRNRLRGAALGRATQLNITTRRLPIMEHLKSMASTKVLTCKHVFDLLLGVRDNDGDWRKALVDVLPSRKDAQA